MFTWDCGSPSTAVYWRSENCCAHSGGMVTAPEKKTTKTNRNINFPKVVVFLATIVPQFTSISKRLAKMTYLKGGQQPGFCFFYIRVALKAFGHATQTRSKQSYRILK